MVSEKEVEKSIETLLRACRENNSYQITNSLKKNPDEVIKKHSVFSPLKK